MDTLQPDVHPLTGYQLRLPSFEGPFDVLLRLIERSQLTITDISLVAVTEQFMTRIAELGGAPAAVIAEFMTVGTRLVLLKSRSLLPRPPTADDESDSASELARELIAYRAVKTASLDLARRDAGGQGTFGRAFGAVAGPTDAPKLARHEANALVRALRRRLSAVVAPLSVFEQRPMVTMREMAMRWLETVRGDDSLTFQRFGATCQDNSELRTAFLALLVLIRRRSIDAHQDQPFGPIQIRLADHAGRVPEVSEFR